MQRHQTHLLGIYTHTNTLALSKRRLLRSVGLSDLPPLPVEEQRTSSTKLLLWLGKLASELKRALEEYALQQEDPCLQHLAGIAQGLKNDRELFTQEQAVIAEIKALRDQWEQQRDPLLRYEQGERQNVRDHLAALLTELERWEGLGRSTKKPLYVRKLERELRENLERAAESERAFNVRQQERYLLARSRLLRVVGRLCGASGRMGRESLVNEAKNDLLRNYIDRFNDGKMSERELEGYRQEYQRTLQGIAQTLRQELHSYSLVLQFAGKLEASATTAYRGILDAEDQFSAEMRGVSEEIFTIVNPRDVIEVVHNCKHFFAFTREWELVKPRLRKAKEPLEDALAALKDTVQRIARDDRDARKGSPVEQFIADKKFMETLVKKESQFEQGMLAVWQGFLDGYLRSLEETPAVVGAQSQPRGGKSRLQGAFDRLFISYLGETEADRQGLSLRHSNRAFIAEIEQLIASISIFGEQADWEGSYACSLGPKLLIHGRVKVLPAGLYYESSFNQRNYFFGRTRLFLPKQELFQVNKQTALLLFPDVLELVTKFGPVYLHALGKRETMYQHFIDAYLPEVNVQQGENQLQFNPFRGDPGLLQQRLQPFLRPLETEIVKFGIQNIDLPTFFHKYWSTTEFSHQGRVFKDFKHFLCELAEGTNVRCSDFTPGLPYYLLPTPAPGTPPPTQDVEQSERLITYNRKIPTIPFVAKGGDGLCHEKMAFHWGGPKLFTIDISTTVSGFPITESMVVLARNVVRETGGKVEMEVSAQVEFGSSSPLNPMIRSPALSNLKDFYARLADKMTKLERNRPPPGSKKADLREECEQQNDRIEQLQTQVAVLKRRIKIMAGLFAVLYLLTLLVFAL